MSPLIIVREADPPIVEASAQTEEIWLYREGVTVILPERPVDGRRIHVIDRSGYAKHEIRAVGVCIDTSAGCFIAEGHGAVELAFDGYQWRTIHFSMAQPACAQYDAQYAEALAPAAEGWRGLQAEEAGVQSNLLVTGPLHLELWAGVPHIVILPQQGNGLYKLEYQINAVNHVPWRPVVASPAGPPRTGLPSLASATTEGTTVRGGMIARMSRGEGFTVQGWFSNLFPCLVSGFQLCATRLS